MVRHLKISGLAMIALIAVTAVSTTSASATTVQWHSAATTTRWFSTATTQLVWTLTAGKIKCNSGNIASTTTESTSSELTATTTVSSCTAFGLAPTILMNGCVDTFTEPAASGGSYQSTAHLKCPAGKKVIWNVPAANCSIEIGEQTPTTPTFDLANEGAGESRDILMTSTLAGITYTVAGPGAICGTPGVYTNGTYTGTSTMKGFKNEAHTEQVGVWVE